MSFDDTVRLAVEHFGDLGSDIVIKMVAIAGCESGFRNNAQGDRPGDVSPGQRGRALNWNCPKGTLDGAASHGLWQIFLGVHHGTVANLSGINESDTCAMANWLHDPDNNARVARFVFDEREGFAPPGFTAWTCWNNGGWRSFESRARQAVNDFLQQPEPEPTPQPQPEPEPTEPPTPSPQPTPQPTTQTGVATLPIALIGFAGVGAFFLIRDRDRQSQ